MIGRIEGNGIREIAVVRSYRAYFGYRNMIFTGRNMKRYLKVLRWQGEDMA